MRNKILSTSLIYVFIILCGLWRSTDAQSPYESTRKLNKIVVETTINALPKPIRAYYQAHIVFIHEIVDLWGSIDSDKPRGEPDFHYIQLDIAASSEDWENRLEAVQRFPHNRKQAKQLLDKLGVKNGGQLPWVILDKQQSLEQAFSKGELASIIHETSALLHFIADAAWPFNTTKDHVNFSCIASLQSLDEQQYRDVKTFPATPEHVNNILTPQLLDRLTYEVRVSPARYQRISDPTKAVFDELIQTYKTIRLLQEATRSTRYEDKLAMKFEERLESVALLGAHLIGSAWENASKPSLITIDVNPNETISKKTNKPTIDITNAKFVGSKHSNIFHRDSCRHVKRIKPANMVRFDTLSKVQLAGRKACKTCKPLQKRP